jgi:hypothetical protein
VATEDALWLRILDVPTALSARRYAIDARLTVTVVDDDFGGWAAGTYRLDGGLSHADCILAPGSTADLTLSQRALAAVYLGGNTVGSQQLAGLVDEHTAGAVNTLDGVGRWRVHPVHQPDVIVDQPEIRIAETEANKQERRLNHLAAQMRKHFLVRGSASRFGPDMQRSSRWPRSDT